jgi:PilZ domain-containing protein
MKSVAFLHATRLRGKYAAIMYIVRPPHRMKQDPPRTRRVGRSEERLRVTLQLAFATGGFGVTRDISPSGVFFHTIEPMHVGDEVRFTVRFASHDGHRHWLLLCDARVLRVEAGGGMKGVAAHILDSRLRTGWDEAS